MVHYRIRAEESPAAVAGAVAKESSGRAARDDSFGGGVGIAMRAIRRQSRCFASTSATMASRLSRHSGSHQSATGAPIGEPHVTIGGAAVSRLAKLGAGSLFPSETCFGASAVVRLDASASNRFRLAAVA